MESLYLAPLRLHPTHLPEGKSRNLKSKAKKNSQVDNEKFPHGEVDNIRFNTLYPLRLLDRPEG